MSASLHEEIDLFSSLPIQTQIEEQTILEIMPTTPLGSEWIEFDIPESDWFSSFMDASFINVLPVTRLECWIEQAVFFLGTRISTPWTANNQLKTLDTK
jgi:hypothetical protein